MTLGSVSDELKQGTMPVIDEDLLFLAFNYFSLRLGFIARGRKSWTRLWEACCGLKLLANLPVIKHSHVKQGVFNGVGGVLRHCFIFYYPITEIMNLV